MDRERDGSTPGRSKSQNKGRSRESKASTAAPDTESGAVLQGPSPVEKAQDFLAMRDHSEEELRTKLLRYYEPEQVEDAIAFAHEKKWLTPPSELAQRVANALHDKKKGFEYISNYLSSKGLPPIERNSEEELRKAHELVESKLAKGLSFDYEGKKELERFLISRGFESETIHEVLKLEEE